MTEQISEGRRRLLAALAGSGVVVAKAWAQPSVDAVRLPPHGQGSAPPPKCVVDYQGPKWVELGANLQPEVELDLVAAICPDCEFAGYDDTARGRVWVSTWTYPVVLIKAGRPTYIATNVRSGQRLTVPADIEHVSLFACRR